MTKNQTLIDSARKARPTLFSSVFIHTHRPCRRPEATLLTWPSSLKRRGRGGRGLSSSTFAESSCYTSTLSPNSTVLSLYVPPRSKCVFFAFFVFFFTQKCQRLWSSSFVFLLQLRRHFRPVTREVHNPSLLLRTRRIAKLSTHNLLHLNFCVGVGKFKRWLQRSLKKRTGIMTRRSCAIYATVIVALIVVVILIVGIALAGAQVFQTLIHERLKKVSFCLYSLVSLMSRAVFYSHISTLCHNFGGSVFCGCFANMQHPDDSRRKCGLFSSVCVWKCSYS